MSPVTVFINLVYLHLFQINPQWVTEVSKFVYGIARSTTPC